MHHCLLFCTLLFTSISAFGMIHPNQPEHEARARYKAELIADFRSKREFFKASPEIHRYLKATMNNLRAKAQQSGQKNNSILLTQLLQDGFLAPASEIQALNNAVQQDPNASAEKKETIKRFLTLYAIQLHFLPSTLMKR